MIEQEEMTKMVMMISSCFLTKFWNFLRWFALLAVLLLFASVTTAQEEDFESWYSISASRKVASKITLLSEMELRLNDNSTRFKKIQIDFGARYKFNKHFSSSISYRYGRFNYYPYYYENENSISIDLKADTKIDRFAVSFRTRLQEVFVNTDGVLISELISRNKAVVEYDIYQSPFTPWVSYEVFIPVNYYSSSIFDKTRFFAGINYLLNKNNEISLFYGVQHNDTKREDKISYILGLNYSIKF